MTMTSTNKRYQNLTSDELKEFMNKHGISEKELCEIFGVTIQCVKLWTSGKRLITLPTSRLVRLFDRNPLLLREF